MIEEKAEALIRELAASPEARTTRRAESRSLAEDLRAAAIDLCMSRATEFSPRIGLLFLYAAKVAALAYLPDSEIPAEYLRDLRHSPDHQETFERFLETIRS
ncbi:MAG: hypothetical protein AAGE52_22070 [Myxococcota bacterium]